MGQAPLHARGGGVVGPFLLHDFVEEALEHARQVIPPDRCDDDEAGGALDQLLVAGDQRVQGASLAEQGQFLDGVAGVEAVGVEIDDVVGAVRLVQGGGGGLQDRVVEGAGVGVGVDDEGSVAVLAVVAAGHEWSPIVMTVCSAARMKSGSALAAPTAMSRV